MGNQIICLLAIIILTASPSSVPAQQSGAAAAELLTLDQAISLAFRDNREVKNAQLGVGKAEDHSLRSSYATAFATAPHSPQHQTDRFID